MRQRKSPSSSKRGRRFAAIPRARQKKSQEPKLSREWIREIERRVRDARDPIRYMLLSEFSRSFILYYDVSSDVFVMNAPDKGTLFKRREAAERVSKLLSPGVRIVKFTTKGGKLRRISPFRGLKHRGSEQPNSGSNGRAASTIPEIAAGLSCRSPRRLALPRDGAAVTSANGKSRKPT
jgi:hypothetical protein